MPAKSIRPAWWQLFVVFLPGVVLLAIQHALAMSEGGHEFSQILIVVVVFGLMFDWISKNAAALVDAEPEPEPSAEDRAWPDQADLRSSDGRSNTIVEPPGLETKEVLLVRLVPASPNARAKAYPFRG